MVIKDLLVPMVEEYGEQLQIIEIDTTQSDGSQLSIVALAGLTIFGTGFSIYLTMLEIFVIQAVCAWCLTSAVVTTLLMLISIRPFSAKPGLSWHARS